METKQITEYNPKALKDKNINFSNWEEKPVLVELNFQNYNCLLSKVHILLYAIESIGYNNDTENLVTCGGLAELCRMILPNKEMELLDSLLIKNKNTEKDFVKL